MDFGSAFGPLRPPKPTPDERLEAQLAVLASTLTELNDNLASIEVDGSSGEAALVRTAVIDTQMMAAQVARAVSDAIKMAPTIGTDAALIEALAEQTKQIRGLGKKISALGIMPSGGSSGHVIVDSGKVSLDSMADVRDLGTHTRMERLEALLTDVRTELRRRRTHKVATALASVTGGAYTTVVTFTAPVAGVITGYNADFRALANARFRMRLTLNGTADAQVLHGEEVTTDANGWVPLQYDYAVGDVLRVQVFHSELTAQDIRATLNYYESP